MSAEILINAGDAPAILSERPLAAGGRLGVVTLSVPQTLNSLTLEMIDIIAPQLRLWAADPEVLAVYLCGAGARAFCAGGDIQALYRAMAANHAAGALVDSYAETFFEREYRLDHLIHRFPKPVICLGTGVVMGGGLGLLSASSHRVVTETSRAAMPEITIGLFPDAGGTALLAGMPGACGVFLGLTGARINGADALATNLGTHLIAADRRDDLEAALLTAAFTGERARDDVMLDALLGDLARQAAAVHPESRIAAHADAIEEALESAQGDYARTLAGMRSLAGRDDWVDGGLANLEKGCPVTAGIVIEQLYRACDMGLADAFRMELVIATHCARHRDFAEGVRALLIDKDGQPQWSTTSLDALPRELVLAHFEPPWSDSPLADLID